jgi:hypothetical protein
MLVILKDKYVICVANVAKQTDRLQIEFRDFKYLRIQMTLNRSSPDRPLTYESSNGVTSETCCK